MAKEFNGHTPFLRIRVLSTILAVLGIASFFRLMDFQIVRGEEFLQQSDQKTTQTVRVQAARGDIVDRYGRILATSETSFCVTLDRMSLKKSMTNTVLVRLIHLFRQSGVKWENDTPLERTEDGEYRYASGKDQAVKQLQKTIRLGNSATAAQCVRKMMERYELNTKTMIRSYPISYEDGNYSFVDGEDRKIRELKQQLNLPENSTASDCMEKMLQTPLAYGFYSEEDAFWILCVRYSMEVQQFGIGNPYYFAENVTSEMVSIIEEQNSWLPGVDITQVPVRVYQNGETASQLIGTVGPIYAEEYEELKEKGYAMNDTVGKSGIESAMEESLRGEDGKVQITKNSSGDRLQTTVKQEAVKGSTVTLTIDSLLQQRLQDLLEDFVSTAHSGNYQSKGGAIVVLDVTTGEVLAAVNSSNYTIEEYQTQYSALLADETNPLFHRAINGLYRPGSSIKPMVAAAALTEGLLQPEEKLLCVSPYHYGGQNFTCLQDHHSGWINLKKALHWSCNTFFYQLGLRMGIDTLNEYASYMGLGQKTGLEIAQAKGRFASPKTTEALGGTWYPGDLLQASIGQNETAISPLQMACEAMTIANRGIRYETHLVQSVTSADGQKTLTEPKIAAQFSMSDSTYEVIAEGMRLAASKVGGENRLDNLGYGVAQKTGTAQTTSTDRVNNDFIGFFPIEDPKIAISCIVEDCDTGTAKLMRNIIEAYEECKEIGERETLPQYPQELEDIML